MKTSLSAKRCPQCSVVTTLDATECLECGHRFRTRFQPILDRTQAFDAVMLARGSAPQSRRPGRARRSGPGFAFGLAFAGSFCLIATVGILSWLAWNVRQETAAPRAQSALYAAAPRLGGGEDLYERIMISMTRYELSQTASGLGRLIRSSNPHLMLLSYDFPTESVRVSLYRPDLRTEDFRVQAVALYHGNTLLQRHADDN